MAKPKKSRAKKPTKAKITTTSASPAELHEAARMARRSGAPKADVEALTDAARDAERAAGLA